MSAIPKTGLKPDSVKNMVFGAGVLFRNFTYGTHYKQTFDKSPQSGKEYYTLTGGPTGGASYTKFEDSVFSPTTKYFEKYEGYGGDKIGATKDGTKVSITPEYKDIDVDGILVKMEGLTRKVGEKASMETVVADLGTENIAMALNGSISYAGENNTNVITTKADIEAGDYIENLAVVAPKIKTGEAVIVLFEKALCTSGFEIDTKNKEVSGNKYTFESYAEQSDENVETLPVKIITLNSKT